MPTEGRNLHLMFKKKVDNRGISDLENVTQKIFI